MRLAYRSSSACILAHSASIFFRRRALLGKSYVAKVGKRVVEQGRVRVRVYTVEHPVQEGVTLREERVAVERRPVDSPASVAPGEAFQDRTIDVTTHREEPVIAKEARVREEV